jgi:hypothetical protein
MKATKKTCSALRILKENLPPPSFVWGGRGKYPRPDGVFYRTGGDNQAGFYSLFYISCTHHNLMLVQKKFWTPTFQKYDENISSRIQLS